MDQVAVGIEAAEERIGQRDFPDIVLDLHPVLDDFRALDLDLFAGSGLIDDAFRVGFAAARRADAFAVNAFVHGDDVARLGKIGGMLDRAERGRLRAGVGVVAVGGDMEFGGVKGGGQHRRRPPGRSLSSSCHVPCGRRSVGIVKPADGDRHIFRPPGVCEIENAPG